MTTQTASRTAITFASSIASGFGDIAKGLFSGLRFLGAYKSLYEFRDLDDHLLRDMGLTRADVDAATVQDFARQPRR